MKLKIFLVLFLVSILSVESFSQKVDPFILMLEFGGAATLASLNGEYALIQKERYQVNARVGGLTLFQKKEEDLRNLMAGANIIFNIQKSHHLEAGSGLSYSYNFSSISDYKVTIREEAISFCPSIGYRYDDLVNGLVFRFAWTPSFPVYDFVNTQSVDLKYREAGADVSTSKPYSLDLPYAVTRIGYFGISMGFRF